MKIVKYCGVWREMWALGTLKSYKRQWRALSVIKINKYNGVGGVCGGHWGGAKMLQNIMVPPLAVIKINKYCSVGGGGGIEGALKFYNK